MKTLTSVFLFLIALQAMPSNAETAAILLENSPKIALIPSMSEQYPIVSVTNDPGRTKAANRIANALASGGGGAWAGTTVGPTEFTKGVWYSAPTINPIGIIPSTSVTNWVSWTYSFERYIVGQRTVLCNYARCVEISGVGQGGTSQFNGDSPNSQFVLYFGVTGTGSISPSIAGRQDQIIVTYQ